MPGKLCEVIAVESDLEKKHKKNMDELKNSFKNHQARYIGFEKRYKPFDEEEAAHEGSTEHKAMDATVHEDLDRMFTAFVDYIDAVAQKEATNQIAKGDIVIDGKVIVGLEHLPATFLLGLESRLRPINEIFDAIPTTPPSQEWEKDDQIGQGVLRRKHDEESFRTRKEPKSTVLYEATKEHPAQIEKWNENVNIGKYITSYWCGLKTPKEKYEFIDRIKKLIKAAKEARSRANTTNVVDIHPADRIVKYLLTGE